MFSTTIYFSLCYFIFSSADVTKVIVPSVHTEWWTKDGEFNPPQWAVNSTIQALFNYSVFMYQKMNPNASNYIGTNRGRENGVYYRYIVDNYDNFPDVAIFVHANPAEHQPKFLEWVGCLSPNASYMNINHHRYFRSTSYWHKYELWIEQCWRDVLRELWSINSTEEMLRLVPVDRPIFVSFYCCQQFVLSREMVHRRPLAVWKRLMSMLGESPVCHSGEPDYENLHAFQKKKIKIGPEPSLLPDTEYTSSPGTGRMTQAVTSEHLSHVIFGHQGLDMEWPTMTSICQHFLPSSKCPDSPCML